MGKQVTLSPAAVKRLNELKSELYSMSQREAWPHPISTSVVLEFLIWWFKATRGEAVSMNDFKPETKVGRRPLPLGEKSTDRPVAPSTIRKLAGLDRPERGGKL